MSFLRDFGASLFTGMGQQMQQQEDEQRKLKIQEALDKRRRRLDVEYELAVNPPEDREAGDPMLTGPAGWVQPTERYVRPTFNPETDEIETPARWEAGPMRPARDPNALDPKTAARLEFDREKLDRMSEDNRYRTDRMASRGGRGGSGSGGGGGGRDLGRPRQHDFRKRPYDDNGRRMIQPERLDADGQWIPDGEPYEERGAGASGGSTKAPSASERAAIADKLATFGKEVDKAETLDELASMLENRGLDPDLFIDTTEVPGKLWGTNTQYSRFEKPLTQEEALREGRKAAKQRFNEYLNPPKSEPEAPAEKPKKPGSKEAIPAPAGAKPGDTVRQKSTNKLFVVQSDGTMVEK